MSMAKALAARQRPLPTSAEITGMADSLSRSSVGELRNIIANEPSRLMQCDANGFSVAHSLVARCGDDLRLELLHYEWVLRIADRGGWSVAHQLARRGPDRVRVVMIETCPLDILKLVTEKGKWGVVHELFMSGSDVVRYILSNISELAPVKDAAGNTLAGLEERKGPRAARRAVNGSIIELLQRSSGNGNGNGNGSGLF